MAKEEDSEDIKGFAAVWDFDWLVYIEHLAVNPAERNNGLGAKILKSIKEQSRVMVCLDVEKPDNEMAVAASVFMSATVFVLTTACICSRPWQKISSRFRCIP